MRSKPSVRRSATIGEDRTQRLERQSFDQCDIVTGLRDECRSSSMPRERMCGAKRVGDGRACCDAGQGNTADQRFDHRGLAAIQMVSASRVDDDAVWRIGRDDGRKALEQPDCKPVERFRICARVRVPHDQARHEDLGLRGRHARPESGGISCNIDCRYDTPVPVTSDQDERRISRRRAGAGVSPHPIGRPGRQEERDDPWHRTPPARNQRFRRRALGSVRRASDGGRRRARLAAARGGELIQSELGARYLAATTLMAINALTNPPIGGSSCLSRQLTIYSTAVRASTQLCRQHL